MRRLIATLVVLALATPAPALAQSGQTNAPPGNSAIDEYLEAVPSAGGNTPTSAIVRSRGGTLRGPSGKALRATGNDGRRLAQIVKATAPKKAVDAAEHPGRATAHPADVGGRSPLSSVADAVLTGSGGGSGMGALFPVLLIVLAAATLGLGLKRRRSTS